MVIFVSFFVELRVKEKESKRERGKKREGQRQRRKKERTERKPTTVGVAVVGPTTALVVVCPELATVGGAKNPTTRKQIVGIS